MTISRTGIGFCLASILFPLITHGCAVSRANSRFDHLVNKVKIKTAVNSNAGFENKSADSLKGKKTLEMETATQIALDNNPSLASMRERVREAVEKYPLVTTLDDPMLGVGFFPLTANFDRADLAYKIDLGQTIPYLGKLGLKGYKAIAEAEVALNSFSSAKLELVQMVKTVYLELFFTHRAIEINEENTNLLQNFKTITESRYSAGKGNLQDVVQVDVDLAKVEHRGITLERKLRVATARLNTLMGRPAGLPLPIPAGLPPVSSFPDKDVLLEKALLQNPSVRAARSRIEAARSSLKLAEYKSYPDFVVTGSYNKAWMTDELRPFIGIGVNIPIGFGRLSAERNIASARLGRANWELKVVEDRIRFQVERIWQKINESRHAEKLFHEALLPETKLNFDAAKAGYSDGKNDFLTLITAERSLVNTKLQYERIRVDLRAGEAALSRVIGKRQ